MSVGQPPASTIAPYRSDALAVAKNVLGWTVGVGSLDSAVSSGGGGGGGFFGFGGVVVAGIGFGVADEAAAGGLSAGAPAPAAGVAPLPEGMNGLGGVADAAGDGAGVDAGGGLGAAAPEGAVVDAAGVEAAGARVCAGAPEAKNGALISAPASKLRNFI